MLLNHSVPLIWSSNDGTILYENLGIFQLEQKKTEKGNLKMQISIAAKITKSELLARKSAHMVTNA